MSTKYFCTPLWRFFLINALYNSVVVGQCLISWLSGWAFCLDTSLFCPLLWCLLLFHALYIMVPLIWNSFHKFQMAVPLDLGDLGHLEMLVERKWKLVLGCKIRFVLLSIRLRHEMSLGNLRYYCHLIHRLYRKSSCSCGIHLNHCFIILDPFNGVHLRMLE